MTDNVETAARTPRVGAVIATRIYTPEPAAAAFRLRGLARALAGAGERVLVLTSSVPGHPDERGARQGVLIRRRPVVRDASGYLRGYLGYMSFDIPLAFRLLAAPRARVIVAEPPPTTGAVVRVIATLRRVPYVYYAADIWSDATAEIGTPGIVTRVLRRVERFAMRGAAEVIAVSDGVAERVRAIAGRPAVVVPNGIDVDLYRPQARPDHVRAVVGDAPFLLYAGTASEWQGAEVFAEAWPEIAEQYPGLQLVFVGSGSRWADIRDAAARLERVHVLAKVPEEEAAGWYASARAALVAVVPGVGYDFAYPTKVFAALASGTPVVYAGPGPARDDITASALGLVTEYEPAAIARTIDEMLSAPVHRRDALHAWVVSNRSSAALSARAAGAVRRAADAGITPVTRHSP